MDDEERKPKHESIDWFDPLIITAFVTAFVCDLLFFLIIPHYVGALIAIPIIWPKTRGPLAKITLILAALLPLPVLTIGIWLAIFLSNKFIAFLAEQAGIQIVAVFTAGAGEALEGAALAGEAAEGAAAAAEATGVVAQAGEATTAVAGAGEAAGAATTEGAEAAGEAGGATEEGTKESIKDKIERKAKEKIREKLEGGPGNEEEEKEEESEEQSEEEARMFGMPETPEQELEGQLFPEVPSTSSVRSISDAPKNVPVPRPPQRLRNGGDSVVSMDQERKKLAEAEKKQEEKQDEWKSARNEDENVEKAA